MMGCRKEAYDGTVISNGVDEVYERLGNSPFWEKPSSIAILLRRRYKRPRAHSFLTTFKNQIRREVLKEKFLFR